MNLSPMSKSDQLKHVWNQEDCSHNLFIRHEDKFTVHRKTTAQSTDCIRGKVCYERGIHLFEITWPANLRGTHASVGVGTGRYIKYSSILFSFPSKNYFSVKSHNFRDLI